MPERRGARRVRIVSSADDVTSLFSSIFHHITSCVPAALVYAIVKGIASNSRVPGDVSADAGLAFTDGLAKTETLYVKKPRTTTIYNVSIMQ